MFSLFFVTLVLLVLLRLEHSFYNFDPFAQPKELKEVKEFLIVARRKDAKHVIIKKQPKGVLKFKVRSSKYLYSLVVRDKEKATKLAESLPKNLVVKRIPEK